MKLFKFSTLVVLLAIINITVFTVATMFITVKGYVAPDSLIQCFFIFWGTEILSLAGIKITKTRNSKTDYQNSFGSNVDEKIENDTSEE